MNAMQTSPPEHIKLLSVRGAPLWCVDRGAGAVVLLVHGFPLDHTMWAEQIPTLSSRHRVLAPDLRGFGRSPTDDDKTTMAQFADDLASMLDALAIAEPVVFCGLSMGGYIALEFQRRHAARLRGLILCDTRASADSPEAAAARRLTADNALLRGVAPLAEAMLPRLFAETTRKERPALLEGVWNVMLSADPRGVAAASRGMAERSDMIHSLGGIRCPTLVIVGDEDAVSPPAEMRRMAKAIPGANYVEIPAAGHLSPLENPAAFNAAVADFISTRL